MINTVVLVTTLAGLGWQSPVLSRGIAIALNEPDYILGLALVRENFKSVVKENTINHRRYRE